MPSIATGSAPTVKAVEERKAPLLLAQVAEEEVCELGWCSLVQACTRNPLVLVMSVAALAK